MSQELNMPLIRLLVVKDWQLFQKQLAALVLAGGTALWAGGRQKESMFHPSLPAPTIVTDTHRAGHLKGLKGGGVLVENLGKDAEDVGLTKDRLQTAIELALRRNGVPVLTQEERRATRGLPYLYVNVQVTREGAFGVEVELSEDVRLERNPRISLGAAVVWRTGGAGTHGGDTDGLVKLVEQFVEQFCLAYRKANPKK